jgi:predicted dehydrogenase
MICRGVGDHIKVAYAAPVLFLISAMKNIRFGILGPGKIANRFASSFEHTTGAKVYAVASRDQAKAKNFADTYHIEKIYGTYEEMINDAEVDVIYIATPHPFHYEQTLQCLKRGKPVLCEKPLALNYRQAHEMIEAAKKSNVFLMEAMWSRFFPATKKVTALVQSGVIGEVNYLQADFGFVAPVDDNNRVYNLALGGGAQLDVGVYPLFLALLLLGKPAEVKAFSTLATTGADATTSALLKFGNGSIAHILSSIVTDSPKQADIMGTKGIIIMQTPWHKSQHVTVKLNTGETIEYPFPYPGNGFQYQIEEVVSCLKANKKESDLMPHSLSLLMAQVSDEIRKQGGVKYKED